VSAHATILQRVVVRMLHDPELRRAVYADPGAALAGLPLGPAEHAMLTRADARAWSVDVHRSDRVFGALLDELGVSAASLLTAGVGLPRLFAFFQSPCFHDAVMARRSLAPAFADYLVGLATDERTRALLELERAIVELRRAPPTAAVPPDRLRTSPRFSPLALPAGTLAAWEAVRQQLGHSVGAALAARATFRVPAVDARAREWVLLEMSESGEPLAGFVSEALGRLLLAAREPVTTAELLRIAGEEGATPDEAEEILADLVVEGLLLA
jgi:hypothetical protein